MGGAACASIPAAGVIHVRYRKGTIALSDTQDYPLLRRVLHCGFVTSGQLYEFLKQDFCTSSRNAFDNRMRRLLAHELLVRREIPTMNRGVVYSISQAGASEMIGRGEYYSGSTDKGEPSSGHVQHALELNDIHLALKRTGMLIRWTPETDIRSQNEFTKIGYGKDYDAAISVRVDGQECQFVLEYERTPKAIARYEAIRKRIEAETNSRHFLYLVPNYDLLLFLLGRFKDCRQPVYFGLRSDFLADTLSLPVRNNRSPVSTVFRTALTAGSVRSNSRGTTAAQALLFT
jgi:hypothetical protein